MRNNPSSNIEGSNKISKSESDGNILNEFEGGMQSFGLVPKGIISFDNSNI